MGITIEDVEYVARLARLKLSEQEKAKYSQQLAQILLYIDKLNKLDTTDISPTYHVLPLTNVFRGDSVRPSLSREEILSNAPEVEGGHFKVKKIIE